MRMISICEKPDTPASRCNRGSALLPVLVFSLFLLGAMSIIARQHTQQSIWPRLQKQWRESVLHARSNFSIQSPQPIDALGQFMAFSGIGKTGVLQSTRASVYAVSAFSDLTWIPSWTALLNPAGSARIACTRHSSATSFPNSAHLCRETEYRLTGDHVFSGDVSVAGDITITPRKGSAITHVTILGALSLDGSLRIENNKPALIEIISAADISIGSVTKLGAAPAQLLLHSAAGKVHLLDIGAYSSCSTPDQKIALQLRAEGLRGIDIGGPLPEPIRNVQLYGCDFGRDPRVWKERRRIMTDD